MSVSAFVNRVLARAGVHVSRTGAEPALVRWARDDSFNAALALARPYTLLGSDRLLTLWQFARATSGLPGAAAQLGVYQGGSALLIARALADSGKEFHLFDTFAGMPETDTAADIHKKGDFSDTSLDAVRALLSPATRVVFHPGLFPATAGPIADKTFSFVYLDADIYRSTKDALEFFYPRTVAGGVIVFDDYRGKHTPGVEKALAEYLSDKPERPAITAIAQCVLIRHA